MKQAGHNRQAAESLALQGVAFLACDDDRIHRFVAVSGLGPTELRENVNDPAVLAGVLDYILGDESLVLEFAEYAGVPPEAPARARAALPGFQEW